MKRSDHWTYRNDERLTSYGYFHSDVDKDEDGQQMYGSSSHNFFERTRIFTVAVWVFLRYDFASL